MVQRYTSDVPAACVQISHAIGLFQCRSGSRGTGRKRSGKSCGRARASSSRKRNFSVAVETKTNSGSFNRTTRLLDMSLAMQTLPTSGSRSRTQTVRLSRTTRVIRCEVSPDACEKRPVLSSVQAAELYAARCEDLRLQYFPVQESRFHDFCATHCVDRKLLLKELGLGPSSAEVLKRLIRGNRQFYYLDLRKNPLGDFGAAMLAGALKDTKSLVHLDLSSNDIGPRGAAAIFHALTYNQSLTSLDLSSHEGLNRNHIGESGLHSIVPLLRHNVFLTILNLTGNGIRVEGLLRIAEGMEGNTTLQSLRLAQNEIQGSATCVQHLRTVVLYSRLAELDLSDNPLGDDCMTDFAQLVGNSGVPLKRLYCVSVGITCIFAMTNQIMIAECANAVFASLRANGMIQTVRLAGNNFGRPGIAAATKDLLGPHSFLQTLDISDCSLGDLGGQSLFSALEDNRALRCIVAQSNELNVILELRKDIIIDTDGESGGGAAATRLGKAEGDRSGPKPP